MECDKYFRVYLLMCDDNNMLQAKCIIPILYIELVWRRYYELTFQLSFRDIN